MAKGKRNPRKCQVVSTGDTVFITNHVLDRFTQRMGIGDKRERLRLLRKMLIRAKPRGMHRRKGGRVVLTGERDKFIAAGEWIFVLGPRPEGDDAYVVTTMFLEPQN